MNQNEFQQQLREWQSYLQVNEPELVHIKEPELRLLYAALMWDQEGVLRVGEYMAAKAEDPLAVLEAMRYAACLLVKDVAEHPEHGDASVFERLASELQAQIQALVAAGKISAVFRVWKDKYDVKYRELAREFSFDGYAKRSTSQAYQPQSEKLMDTIEYSEHLVRIGKDVMRVAENAEAAADNDIEGAARDEAIAKARAKLTDYNSVLAKIESEILKAHFEKRHAFHIDLIRESLEKIDADANEGKNKA